MNKGAIYGIIAAVVAIGIGAAVLASMGPSDDPVPVPVDPPADDTSGGGMDVDTLMIVDVGVLLPATGDLASHGNENKLSLDLAVVDFNMYLEEKGADWRMNLVVEDTQSDPIIALEKAQSLNSKGIKYALGPESSAETRNIMSYADSNDMIILSPSSTSPKLAVADNIFRFVPDDTKQGKVVATLLEQSGIKVVVPIYRGDVWGDGLFESTKQSFEEMGGVVSEGIRFSPEITTFSTEAETLSNSVDKLMQDYEPGEVGVFVIGFDEVVHLFNSALEYETLNNVQWFGSDGNAGASTITDDPRSSQFATSTGFIATQFAASDNEVFEMVKSTFEETTGRTPSNNYVYSSYDSLWVLGLSMEAVGFDSLDVRDQLAATGMDYTGALGTVRLNDAGDLAIADYELWAVVDGEWEPKSRYNAATGEIVSYSQEGSGMMVVDVGVLLPATGDLASHGNENKLSLDLAVVDFNMYLEEKGADWRMNLVVEDTQSDPIIALEKVQSLNSKGIKYALGPESSAETRNIMSYADSNDMIILSPSSTSPALAVADNIFRFVPDDTKQGKVVAAMLEQNGIKVVVPIYRGDVWGDGLFKSTKMSFEELDGVVAEGIRFNPEVTVFSTEAATLAKSVDRLYDDGYAPGEVGVFVIGFDEVIHLFNSALDYDTLKNAPWFGSDGNAGASTITDDPRSSQFATSTGFIATQFAASDNEVFEMVKSTFEETTGRTPSNNYVYSSYDSLWVLGLSMEAVGFDSLDVRDQLAATGMDYTGALGTVRLNDAGDLAIADYELWAVVDGEWEPKSRYNAATGEIVSYDQGMDSTNMIPGDITTVDVGVLLPATGDLASHGNENKLSLDLAVVDFNMYLEEKGADWRMNLVVEDTQSDPIIALEKVQSLNSKGIKYALGPESSAETRNIMSYADSNDMIILSPSSTSPALAVADNIFRFVPDDTKQGKVVAAMLEQNGIKVVVPIYRGDVWGDGLFKSTKMSFEELDGVVAEGIRFNPEVTVFSTEAATLAKSVDRLYDDGYAPGEVGVFVIGFDEVIHLFNSALDYDTLKNAPWFGSDGNAGASTITDDPRSSQFATSTGFIATQFAASDNEVFEMVKSTFEETTGRTPSNNYVYSSYDSLWVLGLSMEAVGFDSLDVRDQLAATGMDYTGALGTVRLNDAGDLAIADYELWAVVDGEWEPKSRYNAATGEIVSYDQGMDSTNMIPGDITTVDVGVLLPATGDLASHGNENKLSLDLAVVDFNMYLEEKGADWRMNLVVEDTQSDPIIALEKVQSLNSKGIKYALGPESSAETRNIMSYADSNDMIILSPSSTSPALAVADNIFRFVPDDTKQGKVVAAMLEQNGIKVVVPIYRGDVWGDGLFKSTKMSFEELDGVVAEGIRFNPEVTVFSTEAATLAKSVDRLYDDGYAPGEVGVFVIGFDEVIHLFNSALDYDTLKNAPWFGSDGNAGASTITDDPRSSQFATSTGFIATQFAASDNEVFEMVKSTFEETTGRTPSNNYVYSSYDSLWVLGLSMEAVGFDSLDVRDQLAATGMDYTGALGTVRLNDAGDLAIADYELWAVVDGEWEPKSRYNAATGEIVGY